jgi:biliverdin reductase
MLMLGNRGVFMMTVRWGVVGVGRAGRARVQALRADPRAVVIGGWRGDPESVDLPSFQSFDDLLQRVDAVAICSPDPHHATQVHASLSAYRHVVCEFPLAASAGEASSLFALAVARDRVLHVEHIELLTPAAAWIREFAAGKTLSGGTIRFSGGARSRVTSPAHANIARFHRVIDAIGVPDDVVVQRCTPSHLGVRFQFGADVSVGMDCRMEEGLERHLELVLEFEEGIIRQEDQEVFLDGSRVELSASKGLFNQDQSSATSAILDGVEPYVSMEQVLEGLSLADLVMGAA